MELPLIGVELTFPCLSMPLKTGPESMLVALSINIAIFGLDIEVSGLR
jgi:hypothetical protein